MKEHEFKDGYCRFCGAMEPGSGCSCLERNENKTDLRPEPKLREKILENQDYISARLEELRLEKTEMINHVNNED
jgi:hypothetical protein